MAAPLLTVSKLLAAIFIAPSSAEDGRIRSLQSLALIAQDAGCKVGIAEPDTDADLHSPALLHCLFQKWYPASTPDAKQMGRAGTYGEITEEGVASIFSAVSELGAGVIGSEDNFYDLGSGLGKMVLQASLTTRVGRAIGVELDKERSALADAALAKMQAAEEQFVADTPLAASRVGFVEGDVRSTSIWANATVVYASSLCFPPSLMLEFTTLLSSTLQPGAVVFSLTALPGCHRGLRRLGTIKVAMTWTKSFDVHVHVLPPVVAHPPMWAHLRDDRTEESMTRHTLQERAKDGWLLETCVTDLAAELSSPALPAARRACAAAEKPGQDSNGPNAHLPMDLGSDIPRKITLDNAFWTIMHLMRGHFSNSSQCLLSDLVALAEIGIEDFEAKRLATNMFGAGEDMTPLGVAGQTVLHAAFQSSLELSSTVLHALLERRVDLQRRDDAGRLPLSLAAQQGHASTVLMLLRNGADVNGVDAGDKAVALHYAVKRFKTDVIEALLNFGAVVNSKDFQDNMPLHHLWTRGGITRAMREVGGSDHAQQAKKQVHIAELLLDHRADVNALDSSGKSLLHRLALQGEDDLVEPLLRARADVNLLDSWGSTPLHGTVVRSETDMAATLLEGKAEVDKVDRGGRSPLSRAIFFGHADMVALLVQFKASPSLKDRSGSSPLKEAENAGHAEIVEALGGANEL